MYIQDQTALSVQFILIYAIRVKVIESGLVFRVYSTIKWHNELQQYKTTSMSRLWELPEKGLKTLLKRLIVWCVTPFSTLFQLYRGGQCIYPCFL